MLMLRILFNVLTILIKVIEHFMDVLLHIIIKIIIDMNALNAPQVILLFLLKMKKYVKIFMKLICNLIV